MGSIIRMVGTAVTLAFVTSASPSPQQVQPVDRQNSVSFYAVSDLTKDPDAQPALQGGIAANPADWPASFYSTHPGGSCTSTLVGPRALLTAAHCVPQQGLAVITYNTKVYSGTCTRSPKYNSGTGAGRSADWALCLMTEDVPAPLFETVSVDASKLAVGQVLLLTGFGCITNTGQGGNDGVYRIGPAKVVKLPSGDDNDIQTEGQAAVCFGDSGGGAFIATVQSPLKRTQVSVNSRIGVDPNTNLLTKRSYLSSLSTPDAREFLEDWAKQKSVQICGVTPGVAKCRSGN